MRMFRSAAGNSVACSDIAARLTHPMTAVRRSKKFQACSHHVACEGACLDGRMRTWKSCRVGAPEEKANAVKV